MAWITSGDKIEWKRSALFWLMHLTPLLLVFTGIHTWDIIVCVVLYFVRMFFITAGYHRYFAHRSYKLSRVMQFIMAFGGASAAQKGPLWWASYHRHHHHHSDQLADIHSPIKGFWWSHMGWIVSPRYVQPRLDLIRDFASYPELRFLDKHILFAPTLVALICLWFGGWSMLIGGFLLSTVLLYHGTFSINSLAHVFGRRRYVTKDSSRNSFILALITCGEGWHNNHHYYPASSRQGFFWWEIDASYYVLKILSWFKLVSNLVVPTKEYLKRNLVKDGYFDIGLFHVHWAKAMRLLPHMKAESKQAYLEARAKIELEWHKLSNATFDQLNQIIHQSISAQSSNNS